MKVVTRIQILLDIIHDDTLSPTDVVRIAANDAWDAITWTDDPDLERATDNIESPITIISATVISTHLHDPSNSNPSRKDPAL